MEKFNRSGYYRRVLTLAFPVILSQAGQILVQLVDNAMVGRLGAVPLAGVSFANAVFFMLFVLGTGMSLGLTPLVGEMYSVSNHRKSAAYLQNSILFYGCMGVCIFLLAMAVSLHVAHGTVARGCPAGRAVLRLCGRFGHPIHGVRIL